MTQTPPARVTKRVHIESGGLSISPPSTYLYEIDPAPQLVFVAVSADVRESQFTPNHVINVEYVSHHEDGPEATLAHWQVALDVALAQQFDAYSLIDLETTLVGGYPGVRRLASYASDEGRSLTIQQWCTIVGQRAYTLTSTVATLDFPFLMDELDEFARGWQIDGLEEQE